MGMGATLVNSLGERYMQKVHPMAEGAPRYLLTLGTYRELKEGRGPCYVDSRHLSKETMDYLVTRLLPVHKDTFMIFCNQKGLNLEKDLLEIDISETQIAGITGCQRNRDRRNRKNDGGPVVCGRRMHNPLLCVVRALATGYTVGREAAQFAANISGRGDIREKKSKRNPGPSMPR